MGESNRGIGFVDVLTTRAGGAIGVDANLAFESFTVGRIDDSRDDRGRASNWGEENRLSFVGHLMLFEFQFRDDERCGIRDSRGDLSFACYLMRMPGTAPESGANKYTPVPSPAASTIPCDSPKRILRGARFATATVRRPIKSFGL